MSNERQADYHRQPRRSDAQRSAQADTQTATTSDGQEELRHCAWKDGPAGCSGPHSAHELVECRGDSLIGEELGPCPDRALVSRLCAARNLQDGEARPFCFKCAEDMMLSMQDGEECQLSPPRGGQRENIAPPSDAAAGGQSAAINAQPLTTLGSVLAGGHHLEAQGQVRRRARQNITLAPARQPALPPRPHCPAASLPSGSTQSAGAVMGMVPPAVLPPAQMQILAARVQLALQGLPSQQGTRIGSQGRVVGTALPSAPTYTSEVPGAGASRAPNAQGQRSMAVCPIAPAAVMQGHENRGAVDPTADCSGNVCSWANARHGCSADMLVPVICNTCKVRRVHHLCVEGNVSNFAELELRQSQYCYQCATQDPALLVLEVEGVSDPSVARNALCIIPEYGQPAGPACPTRAPRQRQQPRGEISATTGLSPARKSARVRAGITRPPRCQGNADEGDVS
ncbi:g9829 [Coccomyxa viridis]|uniref:G9829 protein n=1 Tax=Coccomyxa viridis TaxID=1274662 RepID=A0ABP1G6E6_9CHLO